MYKYSFLKHRCDIRMKVEADDLENLFHAALEGMNSILKENRRVPAESMQILNVNIDSPDTTALLIDFLSEVLTESNIEYHVFEEMDIQELKENHLNAVLYGRRVDGFDTDIKAVTYHEADVKIKRKGYYESVIVFDI